MLKIHSLQTAARTQQRLLDRFLESYVIINKSDAKLVGCDSITFVFALRNYAKREQLSYILAGMQGMRFHHLVSEGDRRVSIWAPALVRDGPLPPKASQMAVEILEYQSFLRFGNFEKK